MRVLLVNKVCNVGGLESFSVALAQELRRGGHECELFFFARGPMEQYLPADCVAHFGGLGDCLRLVRTRGFEIVHVGCADYELGISAVRELGAKLIVTSHGGVSPVWTSATCDAFVGCASWLAEAQQPLTDLPVQVVLNGIDTDRFKPAPSTAPAQPIVAWAGRGVELQHKRIDKLAAIAPALQRAGVHLWLAEPYGPAAVERVAPEAARTLLSIAEFWEPVPARQMPNFLQTVAASGGCLLSTSSLEGLPLVLLEAQACGCPVIAPDVRGINECVDEAHGGVLYPYEIEAARLAELVLATLGDAQTMNWRRAVCAQYACARFSLRRMAKEYLQIYAAAPYAPQSGWAGLRARLRLSPLLHWPDYIGQRWSPGVRQYEASRKLMETKEWDLAAAAARASLATCPTLFTKSARLAHLLKLRARGGVKEV